MIKLLIKKLQESSNADEFNLLYNGNWDTYGSKKEAQRAICKMIAEKTSNPDIIDSIFKNSGLYDDECEHPAYKNMIIYDALDSREEKLSETAEDSSKKFKKPFVCNEEEIYLSVRDEEKCFIFAYIQKNKISYVERVYANSKAIYPQELPFANGEYVPVVGVPIRELIDSAPDLQATELLELLHTHLDKYIDAPETDIEMFIHYILFTWFYPKTNTTPYLRFIGDTGKGKSRFSKVVADLCFYPITAEGASTASGILRFKEQWHGTLKIDEADFSGGAESEIIKYLNLGFEDGHVFIKTNKANFKEQEFYNPFGPKIIAMRKPFQDNATEGRLLSFSPRETTRRDIPANLPPIYENEVEEIRAIITRFVLFNWNNVDPNNLIDCSEMNIEPRLKQLAIPLSLTLQLLPDGETRFKNYINRRQAEIKEMRSQSWEGTLFNYVYALAAGYDEPHSDYSQYATDEGILAITPSMVGAHFGISAKSATQAMTSIGMTIESTTLKIPSDSETKSKKTRLYAIPNEQVWNEIVQRYYYADEGSDEKPSCPEVLKSKRYLN
jgi:hypothetical protein